jgi:hypothetical protein
MVVSFASSALLHQDGFPIWQLTISRMVATVLMQKKTLFQWQLSSGDMLHQESGK